MVMWIFSRRENLRHLRWLTACVLACVSAAFAQPAAKCTVHDPELQGQYTGGCKDGLAQGDGEAEGIARYKGQFRAGHKHGRGVKTWPTGDRYDGQFVNDRKHGLGTYTWGNATLWAGEKYNGHYHNDRRHGHGLYEWPNGDRYDGPWDNDLIAGNPPPKLYARSRALAEIEFAVAKPDNRICQTVVVGVATQDNLRATVLQVDGERIRIRIDDAGNFQRLKSGIAVEKGAIVWDSWQFWTPCV